MPKKRMAPDINGYQRMLWTYVDRRKNLSLKPLESITSIRRRRRKLTIKITNIRTAIKKLENKRAKMHEVDDLMIKFNGLSVFKVGGRHSGELKITKSIFYKYCLELGIPGPEISNFCGLKGRGDRPAISRLQFTKSFQVNKHNRDMYHRFLFFIKNESCQ